MLAAVSMALISASPAIAADSYDAWDLYDHKELVSLGETISMWECWAAGYGTNPRLTQKVGRKWVTLDVSSVSRDSKLCESYRPVKATYSFKIKNSLRWNKKEKSYEAIVKTTCSTCVTYDWTILVDK
jgi:hypothetical protein